jgi:anti-sigma28 factor (negative regulator of flagellin synthesis)
MKISDRLNSASSVPNVKSSSGRQAKTPGPSGSGDQVGLSGLARLSQSVSFQHGAKVSQLAQAVSSGRYQPDAAAVSASIIQHSLVTASAF